jgi:hypothetical protein
MIDSKNINIANNISTPKIATNLNQTNSIIKETDKQGFSTTKKIIGGVTGVSLIGAGGYSIIKDDKDKNVKRY